MPEDRKNLDHAARVDSPLVIERNVDAGDKSDSDRNSLLRDDTPSCDFSSTRPDLNNLIEEVGISDLIGCDFSELVNCRDSLVFDVKPNLHRSSLR